MKGDKKKTFTYASTPAVVEKAKKKAFREGKTVSEKIDEFLKQYVKPEKRNLNKTVDLPMDYLQYKNIGILGPNGTVLPLELKKKK